MLELLSNVNPGTLIVALAMLVPITGIICGTWTNYWLKVKRAELDAALKQEMLQRGMSADEIVQVIEARSREPKRGSCDRSSLAERADS